jgi:hypothetical protein
MSISRKTVLLYLALLSIIALAFSAYLVFRWPLARVNAWNLGQATGGALGIYVMSAVVPLIVWAFRRFAWRSAPLLAWTVSFIAFCILAAFADAENQQAELRRIEKMGPKEIAEFKDGALRRCLTEQKESPLNQQAGITIEQINRFCECIAAGAAESITVDEIRSMVSGIRPPSLREKMDRITLSCAESQ